MRSYRRASCWPPTRRSILMTLEIRFRLISPRPGLLALSTVQRISSEPAIKKAAKRALTDLAKRSFRVRALIAVSSWVVQMCHFLIVNTTQKSVDKGVEQRIYARLSDAIEFEDVPNLPKWIQRIVETGDDEQALVIVDYLNSADGSPWQGKIALANKETKGSTINQKTFVKAIKRYVLTANNPISVREPDERKKDNVGLLEGNRVTSRHWEAHRLVQVKRSRVVLPFLNSALQ